VFLALIVCGGIGWSCDCLCGLTPERIAECSSSAITMVLSQKEADVQMMLAADVHLGTKNCDFQMERYVWKRRSDGMYVLLFIPFTAFLSTPRSPPAQQALSFIIGSNIITSGFVI
jgi:hypothetical protein